MTMEMWELVARESIRDIIARYNSNGDAARWEQLEGLFAADAVMDIDGKIYEGRPAIMDMFRAVQVFKHEDRSEAGPEAPLHTTMTEWLSRGHKPLVRHFTATTQIDVLDETSATARSYYCVLTVHGLDHWGRYVDDFTVVDGRWVFKRRQHRLDAAIEGGRAAGEQSAVGRTVRSL
jgi:SnoaL-like domain